MAELREHQKRGLDLTFQWLFKNKEKRNPCVLAPCGAGKSHMIAEFCRILLHNWPETRILMLTHSKHLIEQNAGKLREYWPNAPMGIYSAGLGKKILGEPITFGGIQSLSSKAEDIGHIDMMVVDECDMIGHTEQNGYRRLIDGLLNINPKMRVIGFTATPYRVGHGMITDKPAIFDDIIEFVTIEELICKGFLAPLRSKSARSRVDKASLESVKKKRNGDYVELEAQKLMDTYERNKAAVLETMELAGNRKHWLVFCAGIEHAKNVADMFNAHGIPADYVTGDMPAKECDAKIKAFKDGHTKVLTNNNILTVGFDFPDIDLIVFLRLPEKSPRLYVQMAGRGQRVKQHTDHCLVLDFVGVVETHGPITNVQPPKKGRKREGAGDPPVKMCDQCNELVHPTTRVCPSCGFEFPPPKAKDLRLRNDDIMGLEGATADINSWLWSVHTSKTSGRPMIKVKYYSEDMSQPIKEYITYGYDGFAGYKARKMIEQMCNRFGIDNPPQDATLEDICAKMTTQPPPVRIEYIKEGKFFKILDRVWDDQKLQDVRELREQ